jgi:hypothetical protein
MLMKPTCRFNRPETTAVRRKAPLPLLLLGKSEFARKRRQGDEKNFLRAYVGQLVSKADCGRFRSEIHPEMFCG